MSEPSEPARLCRPVLTPKGLKRLGWAATGLQLIGVYLLAGRLLPPLPCYAIMLMGSSCGIHYAAQRRDSPLFWLNIGFSLSNVIGIIRWQA